MKFIATIVLLLFTYTAGAQRDTTYYNNDSIVSKRENANYYVLPFVKEGNRYKVTGRLTNHLLSFEGYSSLRDSLLLDGPYSSFYKNGSKCFTGNYKNDKPEGLWKMYREDTAGLWAVVEYSITSDTAEVFKSYYKSGELKRIEYRIKKARQPFNKTKDLDYDTTGIRYSKSGSEKDFTPFMKMPEFKTNVNQYLARSVKYPVKAINRNAEGRVVVKFVVNEIGDIEDVEIKTPDVDPALAKEAARVVKKMNGKWQPGLVDDKPVRVYYTLPILFRLQ